MLLLEGRLLEGRLWCDMATCRQPPGPIQPLEVSEDIPEVGRIGRVGRGGRRGGWERMTGRERGWVGWCPGLRRKEEEWSTRCVGSATTRATQATVSSPHSPSPTSNDSTSTRTHVHTSTRPHVHTGEVFHVSEAMPQVVSRQLCDKTHKSQSAIR